MVCSVDGCERTVTAKGLCRMHYQRVRYYGETGPAWARLTPEQRFWSKVVQDDETGCWVWQGATKHSLGYGVLGIGTRDIKAHRFAYELLVGPIPEGMTIDHLCRNRACVNPGHLEPVSSAENNLRGESFAAHNARKTHCVRGHPLEEPNMFIDGLGRRICRACRSVHRRNRYLRLGK